MNWHCLGAGLALLSTLGHAQAPTNKTEAAAPDLGAIETRVRPAQAVARVPVSLSLSQFLSDVSEKHAELRGAVIRKDSADQIGREAQLPYAFRFFSSAQYMDDARPQVFFQYQKQLVTTLEAGLEKQTNFGLSGKVSYASTRTTVRDLQFGTPLPQTIDTLAVSPVLELRLNLWRNLAGGEVRAQEAFVASQAEAKKYQSAFQQKSILVRAEATYWTLALARESVLVATASQERARKLYEWHERRARLGLGDQADFLNAQAALQRKRLELREAQDREVLAARDFNSVRGIESDRVEGHLEPMTTEMAQKFAPPAKASVREDVKAALAQSIAAQAQAELARQRALPSLDIYGSTARNNPDLRALDRAYDDAFSASRPTHVVGVKFSTPLSVGAVSDVLQGQNREKVAAQYVAERKTFEVEAEWAQLESKYRQAKERLELYVKLEELQRKKLEYERQRYSRGRTVTQQVLNFEIEYDAAQFGRLSTLNEMLQIMAQMKLYGEEV